MIKSLFTRIFTDKKARAERRQETSLWFEHCGRVAVISVGPTTPISNIVDQCLRSFQLSPALYDVLGTIQHAYSPLVPVIWFAKLPANHLHKLIVIRKDVPRPLSAPVYDVSFDVLRSLPDFESPNDIAKRIVQSLHLHGFIRISMPPEKVQLVKDAYSAADWFFALPQIQKRKCRRLVGEGEKFVGYAGQPGREWWQIRRYALPLPFPWPTDEDPDEVKESTPAESSGTAAATGEASPVRMKSSEVDVGGGESPAERFRSKTSELYDLLELISKLLLTAIAIALDIDPNRFLELLDQSPLPEGRFGSDVWRFYKYLSGPERQKQPNPQAAMQPSCGTHADLGLVTVSPRGSVPGLTLLDEALTQWVDAESNALPHHFVAFVGETMGLLTGGYLRAPLHHVNEFFLSNVCRYSAPFFCRARPEAVLPKETEPFFAPPADLFELSTEQPSSVRNRVFRWPSKSKITPPPAFSCEPAVTVRDFMERIVFMERPWRPQSVKESISDY